MATRKKQAARTPIRFERCYNDSIDTLWRMWTTAEGFETWWGPEGFRADVLTIDARPGGELSYVMVAVEEEQVRHMEHEGLPTATPIHGVFGEVEAPRHLKLCSTVDFIPGVAPHETCVNVELSPHGTGVRMVVTVDPLKDEEWTVRTIEGWESQLGKLPAVLKACRT